jgi:hypothetical protein
VFEFLWCADCADPGKRRPLLPLQWNLQWFLDRFGRVGRSVVLLVIPVQAMCRNEAHSASHLVLIIQKRLISVVQPHIGIIAWRTTPLSPPPSPTIPAQTPLPAVVA